jgi:hypothetical protein
LREWAAHYLNAVDGPLSAAQLAAAQKATRPAKTEELAWGELLAQWRGDARGLRLDRASFDAARAAACTPFDRAGLADAAARIDKAAFTRADLVEIIGAQLPVDLDRYPREVVEAAVEEVGMRLTAPRARHQREGRERFTLDRILAEEVTVMDLADSAMTARSCGSRTSTPRDCRRIRRPQCAASGARRGWCNRCPRRRARARPPRCAPCAPPRTTAPTAASHCSPRPGGRSTSRCAKVPATTATPSPKHYSPCATAPSS